MASIRYSSSLKYYISQVNGSFNRWLELMLMFALIHGFLDMLSVRTLSYHMPLIYGPVGPQTSMLSGYGWSDLKLTSMLSGYGG